MSRKGMVQILFGLAALVNIQLASAQQERGIQCSFCEVDYVTKQDLVDSIGDFISPGLSNVTVMEGQAPNTFRVMLPDGRNFSVAPIGPVFRHQNMVQRHLQQTEEGGLHLRSQTRTELQLRSAVHREADVIAEMLRLGWTNFYWFRHGMEVDSPDGNRYCFQPDMRIYPQTPQTNITAELDDDGNLVVIHQDGIRQRLHACAHDFLQLRDRIRAQVQQQLHIAPDGTFVIEVNGESRRYRLSAEMRWSGQLDQPGFYTEGARIYLRYRDGWEQEIVEIG